MIILKCGINNRTMDKKEQAQLQAAIKAIEKLERTVQHMAMRIASLERQNAKLKSATIKNASDIGNVERRVSRG